MIAFAHRVAHFTEVIKASESDADGHIDTRVYKGTRRVVLRLQQLSGLPIRLSR